MKNIFILAGIVVLASTAMGHAEWEVRSGGVGSLPERTILLDDRASQFQVAGAIPCRVDEETEGARHLKCEVAPGASVAIRTCEIPGCASRESSSSKPPPANSPPLSSANEIEVYKDGQFFETITLEWSQ